MLPDDKDELFFQIALTFVSDVGAKTGRALHDHFGTAKDVFRAPLKELKAISGMGEAKVKGFKDPRVFESTETELKFAAKHGVQIISFKNDERYPKRLAQCSDGPLLLYYRGNANLDAQKIVGDLALEIGVDRLREVVAEQDVFGRYGRIRLQLEHPVSVLLLVAVQRARRLRDAGLQRVGSRKRCSCGCCGHGVSPL